MVYDISNILNAANYEDLCNFSIIPPENKLFNIDMLNMDASIFCKTDFLYYLFSEIKESTRSYRLITHHSDYSIDKEIFLNRPKCIKKWFAINPTFEHEDLIPIPLGLKTHKGIYLEEKYKTQWFSENINFLKDKQKQFSIYCNWSETNIYRGSINEQLKTCKIPVVHNSNLPFEEYIGEMSDHLFTISPPGNGIDCHRTWESLYVGCIPIVIKNSIYNQWQDLPILQVNDYSEVTNELLDKFLAKPYIYDKLNIEYWKPKITSLCHE